MKINFLKVEAAGNDFILIDNFDKKYNIDFAELARVISDRHRGIGADGLLIFEKSDIADFKMRYLNADGSESGMCGNGGRCIAGYAAIILRKTNLIFEALDFVYNAEVNSDYVTLFMKEPKIILNNVNIKIDNFSFPINFIDTGAPHAIVFIEEAPELGLNLSDIDVIKIGGKIRFHEKFQPSGTNVDFVQKVSNSTFKIRTYERGVENETLSCGTGTVASAILGSEKYHINPPIKIISLSNEILTVNFLKKENNYHQVSLGGNIHFVFSGNFDYDIQNHLIKAKIIDK